MQQTVEACTPNSELWAVVEANRKSSESQLIFHHVKIDKTFWKFRMSCFDHIREVFLTKCSLRRIPDCLLELKNLQTLDVSGNMIDKVKRVGATWNKTLKILDLSDNHMNYIPLYVYTLESLEKLYLQSNLIGLLEGNDILPEIGNLKQLQVLKLRSNNVRFLPIEMAKLSNLQVLDVSRNNLLFLPGEITRMRFQSFVFDHNHFNDFRIPERPDESPISSLQVIALETHFRTSAESAILPKFENIKKENCSKCSKIAVSPVQRFSSFAAEDGRDQPVQVSVIDHLCSSCILE